MSYETNCLQKVITKDPRYKPAAYEFLFEALESTRGRIAKQRAGKVKHVCGAELLGGLRDLAIQQFGRMAKTVLNQWGICSTSDVGEMVFNLIESGDMGKTDQDSRSRL